MQIFSIFPYQVLVSIFERAFRALSFDPSDLDDKIIDLLSIRAKIEQFVSSIFDLDLGRAGEFLSDPSQISSDPMLGLNSKLSLELMVQKR